MGKLVKLLPKNSGGKKNTERKEDDRAGTDCQLRSLLKEHIVLHDHVACFPEPLYKNKCDM